MQNFLSKPTASITGTQSLERSSFDQAIFENIQKNKDIQYRWSLLSQDIDESSDSQALLSDIIKLWVTINGHAIASLRIEQYKNGEMINTQKSIGFRKSLSGTS